MGFAFLVPMLFILVMTSAAVAAFLAIRRTYQEQQTRRALRAQHASEPWLWRRDWADRAVADLGTRGLGCFWFFAILWTVMSLPAAFLVRHRLESDPLMAFALLFPLIGVVLIGGVAYQTLRRRKYGQSLCHIQHVPIPIGRTMQGQVEVKLTQLPEEGFRMHLTNLRRIVTGSGKNRSVRESVIWHEEKVVRAGGMPNPHGMRVPFTFRIPAETEAADDREESNRVIWRLEVEAEVPGIDYRAVFELPVFQTGGGPDAWTPDLDPRGWTPASDSGIALATAASSGEEIVVKRRGHPREWIGLILFGAF